MNRNRDRSARNSALHVFLVTIKGTLQRLQSLSPQQHISTILSKRDAEHVTRDTRLQLTTFGDRDDSPKPQPMTVLKYVICSENLYLNTCIDSIYIDILQNARQSFYLYTKYLIDGVFGQQKDNCKIFHVLERRLKRNRMNQDK